MSRKTAIFILIPIIGLGFALRLHQLAEVPLRGDEAFSAMFWAEMPIHQSLTEIATIEPHPPLTYVFFHIWNLVVSGIASPFALRMFSVLINIIGIPVMYAIGNHLTKNRFIGLLSAFMWAVHPFEIWHSQDFRNYAIWAGLSVTTLWFGLRLIIHQRKVDWVLYFLFATITAFTFYTELLTLGAFGLYVLLTHRKQKAFITRFLGGQFLVGLAVLVGFLILQGNLLSGGGYGGNVQPFSAPDYLTRFIPTLVLGDSIPPELSNIWIALSVALLIFIGAIYRFSRNIAILLMILIVLPLALLGIISTRMSIFHPRYVISVVPAFILTISIGSYSLAHFASKKIPIYANILALVILSMWFVLSAMTLNIYYNVTHYQKAPAWDELGIFLNKNVGKDDLVIQLSTDAAFGYYYTSAAEDIGLPASPTQPEEDIINTLESAKSEYDSLYIVSNAIPDWQNSDVVETWAHEHMQSVRLSNASGLGIRQYKSWDVTEALAEEALVQFDETIELLDYKLFDSPLPTGEMVLWLYWRPLAQSDTSLKSFVHLVGDVNPDTGSPLWSQDDQFPQDGRLDSTTWDVNSIYRDVYYLPANDLQASDYQILLGWYNPETSTRLTTNFDNDTYMLTTLAYPTK